MKGSGRDRFSHFLDHLRNLGGLRSAILGACLFVIWLAVTGIFDFKEHPQRLSAHLRGESSRFGVLSADCAVRAQATLQLWYALRSTMRCKYLRSPGMKLTLIGHGFEQQGRVLLSENGFRLSDDFTVDYGDSRPAPSFTRVVEARGAS